MPWLTSLAMSRTIIALPSVLAFFVGEFDVGGDGLVLEVGLDLAVEFCGQLAAQWPGWPHLRHFEAACPRWTICPPLVCHVDGPFPRPFLDFDLPFPRPFGVLP